MPSMNSVRCMMNFSDFVFYSKISMSGVPTMNGKSVYIPFDWHENEHIHLLCSCLAMKSMDISVTFDQTCIKARTYCVCVCVCAHTRESQEPQPIWHTIPF